ncbi:MAG: hypothetical protein R6X02_26925 [Enhygromyxa sp.]
MSGRATTLSLLGVLLRQPERLLAGEDEAARDRLALLTPKLLGITVLGAGIFGLVIGSYRGELQYLYAAIKTPALLLLPVLIGLPAIRAFFGACELELGWSRLALAALVAVARTAVLAAACGPVLWLYLSLHPDYHRAILAMSACLIAVGGPGLWTLIRALPEGGRHRPLASFASLVVIGVLLAQSGWLLRPFVVRPRAEVDFLRPIEADVFSSLASTRRAAKGEYRGWDARPGGWLGSRRDVDASEAQP